MYSTCQLFQALQCSIATLLQQCREQFIEIYTNTLWLRMIFFTLFPHFQVRCAQRMIRRLDLLHSHDVEMVCEHGGHGPG